MDENNQRDIGSPMSSVLVDGALPRLKIKAPKPDNACSPKNVAEHLKCELDDSKPVIRIANAGVDLKRKGDALSTSLPSLKLKIPRNQEPQAPDMELSGGKMQLSSSADSSLKLVVSNGKIIRLVNSVDGFHDKRLDIHLGWGIGLDLAVMMHGLHGVCTGLETPPS